MRASDTVMITFAALFGLLAVFIAQAWINGQADERLKNLQARNRPMATLTIVVASRPLRFGNERVLEART